jgi:hypothetical protein
MRRFGLPHMLRVGLRCGVQPERRFSLASVEASYLFVYRPTERELRHFPVSGQLGLLSSAFEIARPRPSQQAGLNQYINSQRRSRGFTAENDALWSAKTRSRHALRWIDPENSANPGVSGAAVKLRRATHPKLDDSSE